MHLRVLSIVLVTPIPKAEAVSGDRDNVTHDTHVGCESHEDYSSIGTLKISAS
jgi:hypothetical protein